MAAVTFDLDQREVTRLMDAIERSSRELNKSNRASIAWAGGLFLSSVAKRTTLSKKKREVRAFKYVPDRRSAKFGMVRYDRNGNEYLQPLWGRGRGGLTRYEKKSEANQDPRRIIGRRGMAKQSWRWAKQRVGKGGPIGKLFGVPALAEIKWGSNTSSPSLLITNRIKYMDKALKGGLPALNNSLESAANKMMKRISQEIENKLGTT